MNTADEPVLGRDFGLPFEPDGDTPPGLNERISALLARQGFGVLCTQGRGQPYGALVGFAYVPDLTMLAFSTPVTTRKFRLLEESPSVSLVIDNRSEHPDDMMQVEAVTVTGRAVRLDAPDARGEWANRLVERHLYLRDFIDAPSTAVFRVDVHRYFYVTRFQEVSEWLPARTG
jgi:nitroimidazol reductase NimA-like FMN-containing flavoprotein (pyridoxamine 5'-phosphate oxidase superfamily)